MYFNDDTPHEDARKNDDIRTNELSKLAKEIKCLKCKVKSSLANAQMHSFDIHAKNLGRWNNPTKVINKTLHLNAWSDYEDDVIKLARLKQQYRELNIIHALCNGTPIKDIETQQVILKNFLHDLFYNHSSIKNELTKVRLRRIEKLISDELKS